MGTFDFLKNKKTTKEVNNTNLNPVISKLIQCTELTSDKILSLVKLKKEREEELYFFSQWITMNSAIASNIDSFLMDKYYINHDVLWMSNRQIAMDYEPTLSEKRVQRFNEYNEFHTAIPLLIQKKYDPKTPKFSRIVFSNLLGENEYYKFLELGPKLPIILAEAMLMHGIILDIVGGDAIIDAEEYVNSGNAKRKLEDYRGAIQDYDKAIKINPNYAETYYNRGIAKNNLEDKKGAIQDFTKAIELNHNFAEAYFERGITNYDLGNKSEAMTDYIKAIELNPSYSLAYCNRGTIKADLGNKSDAIEDFTKAIELDPNYSVPYSNRGAAQYDLGNISDAIEDLTQAIELDSNYASAYYNRGGAKYKLGDKESACKDWAKAAKLGITQASDLINKYCK